MKRISKVCYLLFIDEREMGWKNGFCSMEGIHILDADILVGICGIRDSVVEILVVMGGRKLTVAGVVIFRDCWFCGWDFDVFVEEGEDHVWMGVMGRR